MVTLYTPIVKFILALQLNLSKPQRKHMLYFVHGIVLCAGRKNITQIKIAAKEDCHLSSVTHFLNHSPWCVNRMQRRRMQFIQEKIRKQRAKKGDHRPIVFFIVDDSNCKKDKSTKKMQALDFHYSHSDGKSVWSHSLVTSHIVTEGYSFAWDYRCYLREKYCEQNNLTFKSKNDLAIEMIEAYEPSDDEQVYVLADSWYTSKKLVDACNTRGFHLIAGIKTNRKIAPQGFRIQMKDFASQYIEKSDLHSVTVKNQGTYWVYAYEGPISDIENAKVLLSWENKFVSTQSPFCLICTDLSLDLVTIQRYYHVRWNIECGYRYFKELLGFDQYQLLSDFGIQRFWAIQFLTYNYLELQRHEWLPESPSMTLGDVVRRIRDEHLGQMIVHVYQQALEKKPLKEVLKDLKLTA